MPYQFKSISCVIIFSLLISLLTACGGSNGTNAVTGVQLSRGAITGFGSVYINGVRYHTNSASVSSDDTQLGAVTDLKVGMVATVVSDSSNSVATSVSYEEDVKGPLDGAVTSFNIPISVMGQMVTVDPATVIDNSLSLPLNPGDILEVSGLRQADDSILATYIESKTLGTINKFKVIGNARSVDTGNKTFMIDGLTINYGSANVGDLAGGDPAEGQLVEVKDTNKIYTPGTKILDATKVEPFNQLSASGNSSSSVSNIEIESVATSIVTGGQFSIPNYTVNILPGTVFRYGVEADIQVGTVLQVEATSNGADQLDANKITFKRNSSRMDASVDSGGVNLALNQLTILGVTVQINSNTDLSDKRDSVSSFSIADINPGDFMRIRGFTGNNGVFVATRLERDNNDTRVEIRGIASNIANPVLDILGITVTADAGTLYSDINSNASGAVAFFDALIDGQSIVKARWDSFTSTVDAPKELQLEEVFQ